MAAAGAAMAIAIARNDSDSEGAAERTKTLLRSGADVKNTARPNDPQRAQGPSAPRPSKIGGAEREPLLEQLWQSEKQSDSRCWSSYGGARSRARAAAGAAMAERGALIDSRCWSSYGERRTLSDSEGEDKIKK